MALFVKVARIDRSNGAVELLEYDYAVKRIADVCDLSERRVREGLQKGEQFVTAGYVYELRR